jgi:hypothetical protein
MTSTLYRVPKHTSDRINREIRENLAEKVRSYAARPEGISRRLQELADEWDIERAIEANASSLAFIGIALGFFVHPYWLVLPASVTAFLFQHAVQGWCPPVPILRRLGFRTAHEIEMEPNALKAIRGDFDRVQGAADKAGEALRAVDA